MGQGMLKAGQGANLVHTQAPWPTMSHIVQCVYYVAHILPWGVKFAVQAACTSVVGMRSSRFVSTGPRWPNGSVGYPKRLAVTTPRGTGFCGSGGFEIAGLLIQQNKMTANNGHAFCTQPCIFRPPLPKDISLDIPIITRCHFKTRRRPCEGKGTQGFLFSDHHF